MALKTKATKQEKADQIYYAFRGFFPGLKEETGGLEEALADMLRYARYYAAFSIKDRTVSVFRYQYDDKYPEDAVLHQYKYLGVAPQTS